MNICVLGGAGFIGSHVCERLLQCGHTVICVDNFQTSSKANIEPFFDHPHFRFVFHDVCEPMDIPCDAQIHLAAIASPKHYMKDPLKTALTIGIGSKHVLDNALKYCAPTLLVSTSEVYGEPLVHPQPESYHGNVSIQSLRASYDESKRYMETLGFIYAHEYHLNIKTVRLFNTYGPRMQLHDGRIVTEMIYAYLNNLPLTIQGDGSQTRCFSYVDDTVSQLLHVFFHGDSGCVINCGHNEEMSINELIEEFENITNSTLEKKYVPSLDHDPKLRKPDLTSLEKLMTRTVTPLRLGLIKTLESFKL